jgi:hypothetical protein
LFVEVALRERSHLSLGRQSIHFRTAKPLPAGSLLATAFALRFNHWMPWRVDLSELQADEIRSFLLHKRMEVWIRTAIEVWSALVTLVKSAAVRVINA